MRTDILDALQNEVYARCKEPTNQFGMGYYYHIEAVVKNSELLAEVTVAYEQGNEELLYRAKAVKNNRNDTRKYNNEHHN